MKPIEEGVERLQHKCFNETFIIEKTRVPLELMIFLLNLL
jgi:hypothetical protein